LQGKTASISVGTGTNIIKLHNSRCSGTGDRFMGKAGVHFFDGSTNSIDQKTIGKVNLKE